MLYIRTPVWASTSNYRLQNGGAGGKCCGLKLLFLTKLHLPRSLSLNQEVVQSQTDTCDNKLQFIFINFCVCIYFFEDTINVLYNSSDEPLTVFLSDWTQLNSILSRYDPPAVDRYIIHDCEGVSASALCPKINLQKSVDMMMFSLFNENTSRDDVQPLTRTESRFHFLYSELLMLMLCGYLKLRLTAQMFPVSAALTWSLSNFLFSSFTWVQSKIEESPLHSFRTFLTSLRPKSTSYYTLILSRFWE